MKGKKNNINNYFDSITSKLEKVASIGNAPSADMFKQLIGISPSTSKQLNYLINCNLALLDILGMESSKVVMSDGIYKSKKVSPIINVLKSGFASVGSMLKDIRDHLSKKTKTPGEKSEKEKTKDKIEGKSQGFEFDVKKVDIKSFVEVIKSMKSLKKLIEEMASKKFEKLSQTAGKVIEKFFGLLARSAEQLKDANKSFKEFSGNYLKIMIGLGAGLLVLVGALILAKFIDWASAGLLIVFISSIVTVLYLVTKKKVSLTGGIKKGGNTNALVSFALGISILLIAINAILEVDWSQAWKLIFFIYAISLALHSGTLLSRLTGGGRGGNEGMLKFAFGVGLLLLTVLAVSEIGDKDWLATGKLILFIVLISLAVATGSLIGRGKSEGLGSGSGLKGVFGFALGIAILVLAIYAVGEIPMSTWGTAKYLIYFILAISITLAISSRISGSTSSGPSWQALSIAASIFIITGAMLLLDKIKDPINLLKIASIMTGAFLLFAIMSGLLGRFVTPLQMVPVAIVAGIILISSISMKILGDTPSDGLLIKAGIMTGAFLLFSAMAVGLSFLGPLIFVGAGAMIILGVSMLLASKTLKTISESKIDANKIKTFTKGLKTLTLGISEIGLRKTLKASATAMAIRPVLKSSLNFAYLLKSISGVEVKDDEMQNFLKALTSFVDSFSKELSTSAKITKGMGANLKSITSVVNLAKGFIDIIQTLGSGKIAEYGVKDGKIVVTGVRPIDLDKDVASASKFIGLMISGLLKPMLEIGSNKDQWVFGDVIVPNLYKKKTFKKGEERMRLLGSAYKPLLDSMIQILGQSEKLTDEKTMTLMNKSIGLFIDSMFDTLNKIQNAPPVNLYAVKTFTNFVNSLNDIDWKTTVSESDKFAKNIGKAVKNINGLKLKNAQELNQTLKLFSQMKLENKTKESVDKLILLISKMNDYQKQVDENTQQVVQNTAKTSKQLEENNKVITKRSKQTITVEDLNMIIYSLKEDIRLMIPKEVLAVIKNSPLLVKIKEN